MSYIKNIAIIGATGRVGSHFATELVKTGKHQVTSLTRAGSKADVPAGTTSISVDYDSEESLADALKGQEFLIVTLPTTAPKELSSRIVQAAAKAGVKWVIPNVFGSDVANEKFASEDLYGIRALGRCKEVEAAGMAYLAVSCGFWYEWSLSWGDRAFGFDIPNKRVTFFDGGVTSITVSTWEQCGRAIASLLSLPESGPSPSIEQWRNKPLYFLSFTVCQRDMLDSLHRVLGTSDSDWTISHQSSKERYSQGLAELQTGDRMGFVQAMYTRTFFPTGDGNYEYRGLANNVLSLPEEDLDECTKRAVAIAQGQ